MLTRLREAHADERGVTMIEVLVVIVLIGLVGSVVTSSLVQGMRVTAETQSRFHALADLQKSVDRMTRELRAAIAVDVMDANRTAVVVYRENFTRQVRFTYTYCPTEQRLHVKQETLVTPEPPAKIAAFPAITSPASCPSADPVLVEPVSNNGTAMFQYLTAPTATVAAVTPTSTSTVGQIRALVARDLPSQPPITVETWVRLRNVR